MWGFGCWGKVFTEFMKQRLEHLSPYANEIVLGDIFQDAAEAGLNVRVLPFENGEYVDIGTWEDLVDIIRKYSKYVERKLKIIT
jgi:hypothetical protein